MGKGENFAEFSSNLSCFEVSSKSQCALNVTAKKPVQKQVSEYLSPRHQILTCFSAVTYCFNTNLIKRICKY